MKVGPSRKIKKSDCLSCGKTLDAAKGVDGAVRPTPGSISICLYCGHIAAYAKNLALRELTDKEIIEVAGNPAIIAIQKARGLMPKKAGNS